MSSYPKKFLSVEQLVEKLKNAGMTISSDDEAKIALATIGYYRLKGYSYHFIDQTTKQYFKGTNLNNILRLYFFDSELSNLLFSYLSQIEVALRARLVNALQVTHDPLVLYDPSISINKKMFWKNQSTIASEINRSTDIFIEHNFKNHDGAIPIWAAVEIMSFGTLSKTIKNMKAGNNGAFAKLIQDYQFSNSAGHNINPSKDAFTSWIQAASVMRNICAHDGRIYNRAIVTRPQLLSCDVVNPQPRYNGLYQMMLAMKYLRPAQDSWDAFITDFKALIHKYDDVCDIRRLNFPPDWELHF